MAEIKGTAIRGLLRSIKDRGWAIAGVVAALPPDVREHYAKQIASYTWYPYRAFTALLETIEKVHGPQNPQLLRDLGREVAGRDLSMTFKVLLSVAKMEFIAQRNQVMWARHCNAGECVLQSYSPNQCVGELRGFPDIHPKHCQQYNEGWLEGLVGGLGAEKPFTKHTRCVHRGDPLCEYTTTWTRLHRLFG